jgi:type I restriction enzyme S subunit
MLRTTNVRGGFVDTENVRYVTLETYERWTRRLLPQRGDVFLTREAPLGDVGRLTSDDKVFLGQRLFHYRTNPELMDARFLAYVLQAPRVQGWIKGLGMGATVEHARVGDFHKIPIPTPPLDEQVRIGNTLSAYDDLIENNWRRIALLDEAARMLYREWFVCFRFPGHEHVEMIDGVPGGWQRRSLIDLAEVVMGQSPKSQFYNDTGEGLPFHQGVTDYGFRFVSNRIFSSAATKTAEAGDILVSVRAPVGRVNITRDKIVLGRGLAAVRSKTDHQSFLFYAIKNHFFAEDIIGTGAIYAATNKKELEGQVFLEPPSVLLREFEDHASAIDAQILCLTAQIEKLIQARDLLLPRLMNGGLAA